MSLQNPVSTWHEYYTATLSKPLHPLYSELEPYLPTNGKALELGCGVGHGVLWLLEAGLQTTAVDLEPEALAIVAERTPRHLRERLEIACCDMTQFEFDSYDVVVAGFSLFFLPKESIDRLWSRIRGSLRPGGIFMGQFLGSNDDWADRLAWHSRQELDHLLGGMTILLLEEVERDGTTAQGTEKHWHVYHVIART